MRNTISFLVILLKKLYNLPHDILEDLGTLHAAARIIFKYAINIIDDTLQEIQNHPLTTIPLDLTHKRLLIILLDNDKAIIEREKS